MMRELRLGLFFLVGLALGGGAVSAFAAPSTYGRSMHLNYPNSGQARAPGWYSQPRYDFPGAPDGWGQLRDINTLEIGGRRVDLEGVRRFGPRTLASGALGLARALGPIGIGLTVAELVWDEAQGWLIDPPPTAEEDVPRDYQAGAYWIIGWPGTFDTPRAACLSMQPNQPTTGAYFWTGGSTFSCVRQSGYDPVNWGRGPELVCPSGSQDLGNGWCRVSGVDEAPRPVTDAELEDAIYVDLVARGMGSELARRLIEAGYTPTPDEVTGTGPSSVPGDTITSTTSGPAGQTTSTTHTTHNISYDTNTTNNTTTVTITNTTTTTTTAPDGTTTTETSTRAPAEGGTVPPPEEPKPFCELYPTASACAELGETPDEELEEQSVDVLWDQQGGAAGACPAPIQISVLGSQYAVQWTPICQVASGIRPIVIGLAWLSAAVWLFLMARARA